MWLILQYCTVQNVHWHRRESYRTVQQNLPQIPGILLIEDPTSLIWFLFLVISSLTNYWRSTSTSISTKVSPWYLQYVYNAYGEIRLSTSYDDISVAAPCVVQLYPQVLHQLHIEKCHGNSTSSSSFLVVVFCVLLRAQYTNAVFNMMFLSQALSRLAARPAMRRLTDLSRSRKISHLALVPICSLEHR